MTVAVYFPGSSANDAAHRLHTALHRYECGAWRRDRVSDVCPSRHTGRINGHCWQILRVIERTPTIKLDESTSLPDTWARLRELVNAA